MTWSEPAIKNGEIKNYSVTIQSHGPLYSTDPENCVIDTETYTYYQTPNITSFTFAEAKPFYRYSVVIAAATSVGYGSASNEEFVETKSDKPEPPEILNYYHQVNDLTDYDVIGVVTWRKPCEINGVFSHFRIVVDGVSTYDDQAEKYEFEVDDDTGNFTFSTERPLQAAFNYSFLITVVLEDGSFESDDAEVNFLAPDGCNVYYNLIKSHIIHCLLLVPGQPVFDRTQETGSTYFTFTWFEPAVKNGKLQNYNISIQPHGPLYAISEKCSVDTTLRSYIHPADSTAFTFTEAKPYYNYTITVSAATSIGYGAESDENFATTEQAQPEPPEELSSSYEEFDLTDYNVTATISWDVPCEVNGVLSHFKVVVEGQSTYDDGSDKQEVKVENTGDFSFSLTHSLKAAYDYQFTIRNVLGNELESVDAEIGLLAPDGCKLYFFLNHSFTFINFKLFL